MSRITDDSSSLTTNGEDPAFHQMKFRLLLSRSFEVGSLTALR